MPSADGLRYQERTLATTRRRNEEQRRPLAKAAKIAKVGKAELQMDPRLRKGDGSIADRNA
jgi:hypothetical protein